ncbi:MAG: hypothetical protein U9Q19_05430 [Pseudomonadota bacterium]|nr:hypothetical protein [Pseudomonadota bacterium]
MTPEQAAAYVHAQAVAATAAIESMKAANTLREMQGKTIAYDEQAFLSVLEQYGLHHNAVMTTFQNCD